MYSFGSTFSYVEKNKGSEGTIQKYAQRISYRLQLCLLGSVFFSRNMGNPNFWEVSNIDSCWHPR